MSTKAKEAIQLKGKNISAPSTPHNMDIPNARRTTKLSIADSPEKDIPILPEKPKPNYLKPTVSSRQEVSGYGNKKQPSDAASSAWKRLSLKKSIDKPPSQQVLQAQKTPKTSSPSPKPAISSKPVSDKASKTPPRSGRTNPPLTKAKRRETNVTTSTTTGINPDVIEISAIKPEQEEELLINVEPDVIEAEETEHNPMHLPLFQDNIVEELKNLEADDDSTIQMDQQETNSPMQEPEGAKEDEGVTTEIKDIVEAKAGHSEGLEENLASEGEVGKEGDDTSKPRAHGGKPESGDESAPRKLKFRQAGKETGGEGTEEAGEAENMVLKRQEKKEATAYNEVIEETASKLVEKRKSKVKALVGAFETVISLQEPEGQLGKEECSNTTKELTEST